VLCAVLLVPMTALAAIYVAGNAGITPTGLAQAGHPQAGGQAGSTQAGNASGRGARTVSTAGAAGARRPAGHGPTTGHGRHPARLPVTASSSPTPTPSSSPSSSASPKPSPPASTPPPSQQPGVASQVLALINQARVQAGLPLYSLSSGLDNSAAAHNARMAAGCGLSHQCPGEPPLGARETGAGVTWTSAGENIGEGGPVPDTSAAIAQMALALTQDMLNEKPPNDGHRLSLLSSAYQIVGIAVYRDSSGTVWMTQDFAN
jgi:uncharacterized protein YkwD